MTGSFWLAASLFVATCSAFSWACIRWKRAAFAFAAAMAVAFPFLSDTSDWSSWFDWVKRYTIVHPGWLALNVGLAAWVLWRQIRGVIGRASRGDGGRATARAAAGGSPTPGGVR